MNILYINHYAGSIYHGMEYRPYYLAREWVRLGHSVTIIASDLSHLRHTNAQIPAGRNYLHETIDGINYIWCRTVPYGENGLKRVINIFSFLILYFVLFSIYVLPQLEDNWFMFFLPLMALPVINTLCKNFNILILFAIQFAYCILVVNK